MFDLTEVVVALIGLLGALITAFLIPYLKQKVSVENLNEINRIIGIAVWAAEMLYKGSGRGEEKKEYVYKCINDFLAKHKMKLDMSTIENMIEAAVLEMKNSVTPAEG